MDIKTEADPAYAKLRGHARPLLELAAECGFQCYCSDNPEADGRLGVHFSNVDVEVVEYLGHHDQSGELLEYLCPMERETLHIDDKMQIYAFIGLDETHLATLIISHPDYKAPIGFVFTREE